ncbi:pentatricopeptide repeat-containing protein, mitochondrial-like protein [Salvia divinorum]|uniref:Pentatricopeptide repeat-containing protein, mitochondrial-like protein n=1 Tax=Salvia divinorum TaxID=28513 RepID=A0ABD1I2M3_SALDI
MIRNAKFSRQIQKFSFFQKNFSDSKTLSFSSTIPTKPSNSIKKSLATPSTKNSISAEMKFNDFISRCLLTHKDDLFLRERLQIGLSPQPVRRNAAKRLNHVESDDQRLHQLREPRYDVVR